MHLRTRPAAAWKVLAVWAFLALAGGNAFTQQAVSVRDLRREFEPRLKNELVTVHGWVSSERRVASRTYKGYYIKDRFGDFLLVRTTEVLPDINAELDVSGVAVRDADTGDVYITETKRGLSRAAAVSGAASSAGATPGSSTPTASTPSPGASPGSTGTRTPGVQPPVTSPIGTAGGRLPILLGLGTVTLALIGVATYLLTRRQPAKALSFEPTVASDGTSSYHEPVSAVVHSAVSVDDYKTVKVYKTTKVLPATLVVIEGKQETDVIHLTDQSGRGEVEIGRDSPDATDGIRIKDRTNTLSRRQARLIYDGATREFSLVNLAADTSNPSVLNGRQMTEDERATLKDGDTLIMGNVELKFRQR